MPQTEKKRGSVKVKIAIITTLGGIIGAYIGIPAIQANINILVVNTTEVIKDVILPSKDMVVADKTTDNFSPQRALFLGKIPEKKGIEDTVEGYKAKYYSFSVKRKSDVKIIFNKNSNKLKAALITPSGMTLAEDNLIKPGEMIKAYLIEGDYIVKVQCKYKNEASVFEMIAEASDPI